MDDSRTGTPRTSRPQERDPAVRAYADKFFARYQPRQQARIEYGSNQHHSLFARIKTDEILYRVGLLPPERCHRDASLWDMPKHILLEAARDYLSLAGSQPPPRAEVSQTFQRALTSSDFAGLLENVMHKALTLGYVNAGETWQLWTRTTTAPNFLEFTRPIPPTLATPPEVGANAEIQSGLLGVRTPGGERGQLVSYAENVNVSREALVDDDLASITLSMAAAGRSISRLIGDRVYEILTNNPETADGQYLCTASHGNVIGSGSGGAPDVTQLDAMRALMAAQTGPGNEVLNLRPRFVLAPVGMESKLAALRSSMNADRDELSTGRISTVTDARLTGLPWWVVGDPLVSEAVQVVVPEGMEAMPVRFERRRVQGDGTIFLIGADVAVLPVNHRCLVRNAGE